MISQYKTDETELAIFEYMYCEYVSTKLYHTYVICNDPFHIVGPLWRAWF